MPAEEPEPGARLSHQPDRSRYVATLDGRPIVAADYRLSDGTVLFHHTFTEPLHRGSGRAAELISFALDDVRRSGRRVSATCWYVAQFLDDHPEYEDLRAGGPA